MEKIIDFTKKQKEKEELKEVCKAFDGFISFTMTDEKGNTKEINFTEYIEILSGKSLK